MIFCSQVPFRDWVMVQRLVAHVGRKLDGHFLLICALTIWSKVSLYEKGRLEHFLFPGAVWRFGQRGTHVAMACAACCIFF